MKLEIRDSEAANCQFPVMANPTMKVTAMAINLQVMDLASERLLAITKTHAQPARRFRRCLERRLF